MQVLMQDLMYNPVALWELGTKGQVSQPLLL